MMYFVIFLILTSFAILFIPYAFANCISLPCDDANIGLGEPNYRFIDFSYQNKVGEPIVFVLEKTSIYNCDSYVATITNEDNEVVWTQSKDYQCTTSKSSELMTSQIKLGYEKDNPIIMPESSRYHLKVQVDDGSIQKEFVARENFSGISLDRTVYSIPWESRSQIENINGSLFRVIGSFTLQAQSNDTIRLGNVEFSYPYFPVPTPPGGVQSVSISFQDGIKESIGTVGPPNPFLKFTEHENPKAGVRRNSDGTFDYLLSITNRSISPLKQFTLRIPIDQIQCKEGLELILKSSDGSPTCVKPETKQKLIERGWAENHSVSLNSPPGSLRVPDDPISITINGNDIDPIIPIKRGEIKNIDILIVPKIPIIQSSVNVESYFGSACDKNATVYCPSKNIIMDLSDTSITSQKEIILTVSVPDNMIIGQYPYQITTKTTLNSSYYDKPINVGNFARFDLLVK